MNTRMKEKLIRIATSMIFDKLDAAVKRDGFLDKDYTPTIIEEWLDSLYQDAYDEGFNDGEDEGFNTGYDAGKEFVERNGQK